MTLTRLVASPDGDALMEHLNTIVNIIWSFKNIKSNIGKFT
jgi:hypothetical protein